MDKINSILFVSLFTACMRGPMASDDSNAESSTSSTMDFGSDGSSDSGYEEAGESGESDSSLLKFDLLDVPDAPPIEPWCGDGVINGNEDCDTALPLIDTCPNQPGIRTCRADCTWDTTWCECVPGTLGCQCASVPCVDGLACSVNMVCEPSSCTQYGESCLAVYPCCAGYYCVEDPNNVGSFACL